MKVCLVLVMMSRHVAFVGEWWRLYGGLFPFGQTTVHNDKVCNNLQQEGEAAAEEDSEAARERMLRVEEEMNRAAWEHGTPDYRGAASMDNILKKIDSTLNNSQSGKLTTSTALLFPTMQK